MSISIRDLAEKLNLSITTVSRALDGYSDVAEETRKRVVRAAQELGYEPSYAARQLRRKRTDSIGYILPTSSPQFSDPFYTNFLTGLCDEVAALDLDLVVTSSAPESEKEQREYRRWVQSRRVDGIVLNRTRVQDWRVDYLLQNEIPFSTLGRSQTSTGYPFVEVDERGSLRELVNHLARKGHQRIAFIGAPAGLLLQSERSAGYRQGLQDAQLAIDPQLMVAGDLTEEGGFHAALALLEQSAAPTAIIGCNDLTALGILRAANKKGLAVGSQLAIAGYDGIKETEYTNPPLTTIHQPTYEIARQLAHMLVKTIEGEKFQEAQPVIKPEVIIRASTG